MTFTITVPQASHPQIVAALKKIPHVTMHDEKSGHSVNSDGTEIDFKATGGDNVDIKVTKNPQKLPQSYIQEKIKVTIDQLSKTTS
jgi:hypothetical protein